MTSNSVTKITKIKRITTIQTKRLSISIINLLRSPWAILVSVLLAIYIGTTHRELAIAIAPLGNFYLGLLKMCVLPILLSAITTSIGRLMQSSNASHYVKRILVVFPLSLIAVSSFATIMPMISGPGRNLSTQTLSALGVLVNNSGIDLEIALIGPIAEEGDFLGLSDFMLNLVPDNIFGALSEGETLKVLIFSIVVGLSLGLIRDRVTEPCFDILESTYRTFNQLINWLTVGLPIGLFSLLAYQLSQQGLDVMVSMLNFIVTALITFSIVYVVCTLIVWQQSKASFPAVIAALREPTILALATTSSLACLPSAIAQLSKSLGFEQQTVNLVAPLSITICRFGSVIYFALGALFVMQLYDKPVGLGSLIIVVVGSIFAGMATSGVTGILTLTMLGIVLEPLQLPLEAVLVLFVAIDPIINPIRTLGIVHTGIAATSIIADIPEPEAA
ncbi:MAG: cation:dicarboxylase symporter family transporter [Cyanobacteria bacterium P01_F01_bin.150]